MPSSRDRRRLLRAILSLLLLAALRAPEPAAGAPRIGLALSGGGARGAAHIGVLKALERANVKVHCIAGTSFGAVVGGLYALGYSAAEIEAIFTNQDWNSLFSDAPERRLSPVTEFRDYRYLAQLHFSGASLALPTGLRVGQKMIDALSALTLPRMRDAQEDFDRLPVPFRAVATDLVTGRRYVFRSGSMAEAMRASFAIPMLFTPVEKGDMLLVDGGLTNNLPTDIVRDMGADIIIGVDVTAPLLEKDQIRSFLDVLDQSLSLLMRRDVEENARRATLLIRPDLEGFTYNDYDRIAGLIARGELAGNSRAAELRAFAGPAMPAPDSALPAAAPGVDAIELRGLHKVRPELVRGELRSRAGEKLQPEVLMKDMQRLFATRLFDSVYAGIEPAGGDRSRLIFQLKEAAPNTLGASLRYDRAYDFVALVEGTARRLFGTPSSATISSQFGGIEDHSLSLRYIPSGLPFFYLEPKGHVRRRERGDIRDGESVDRYTDSRIGGQIAVGGVLFRKLDIQLAYRYDKARIGGGSPPHSLAEDMRLAGLTLRLQGDTLDAPDFPSSGIMVRFQADGRSQRLGSDLSYSKYRAELEQYVAISTRNTLVFQAATGIARGPIPFFDRYYAGGFSYSEGASRRLLGYEQDEVLAKQAAALSLGFRRQVFSSPLSFARRGFVEVIYNGLASSQRDTQPYRAQFLHGGGLVFSLDTMLGPMRIAGGWGEGGRGKIYLSLGPGF